MLLYDVTDGSFEVFELFELEDESFHETETVHSVVIVSDVRERHLRGSRFEAYEIFCTDGWNRQPIATSTQGDMVISLNRVKLTLTSGMETLLKPTFHLDPSN